MKIIDICEFYSNFGGGVRTYVHQKFEAYSRTGCEAIVIAPGPVDRREKRAGGEIIWVRSPTLVFDHRYNAFSRAKPIHDLLDEIKPHFIEASSSWRGGWIASSWKGVAPRALFLHQDPVAAYPQALLSPRIDEAHVDRLCFWFWNYLRRLADGFDRIVVSSDWFAKRIETHCGRRALVAPIGIDKSAFNAKLRDEETRRDMLGACGIDDPTAPLFIAISRFHPEKRLGVLMEAFDRFRRERPAGLFIIGDGPAWRMVRKEAAARANIHIAGHVSDRVALARHLASADYFIHGGAAETFGLVVAEALSSGLPLVTPHIGGAAELAHPTYSETYRAGDAEAFAQALRRIAGRDRGALSLAARAGAHRLKTPDEHFRGLLENYAALYCEKTMRAAA